MPLALCVIQKRSLEDNPEIFCSDLADGSDESTNQNSEGGCFRVPCLAFLPSSSSCPSYGSILPLIVAI